MYLGQVGKWPRSHAKHLDSRPPSAPSSVWALRSPSQESFLHVPEAGAAITAAPIFCQPSLLTSEERMFPENQVQPSCDKAAPKSSNQ